MQLDGNIEEISGLGTIYHEATHAYLDLMEDDPRFAPVLQSAEAYYRTQGRLENGGAVTDPAEVVQEAAAGYVGHRVVTWWQAFERLHWIAELDVEQRQNPSINRMFTRIPEEYNRGMRQRVFGYESSLGAALTGGDQVHTTTAMPDNLRELCDNEILEGRIHDRFEDDSRLVYASELDAGEPDGGVD
jgi:hypothetical protein